LPHLHKKSNGLLPKIPKMAKKIAVGKREVQIVAIKLICSLAHVARATKKEKEIP